MCEKILLFPQSDHLFSFTCNTDVSIGNQDTTFLDLFSLQDLKRCYSVTLCHGIICNFIIKLSNFKQMFLNSQESTQHIVTIILDNYTRKYIKGARCKLGRFNYWMLSSADNGQCAMPCSTNTGRENFKILKYQASEVP